MGAARVGRLHKLYVDADGDIASPTWVEYGEIQGASVTCQRDVAEVKERSVQETTVMLGHINTEVSLTVTKRPGNTNYDILRSAFYAGAKVGIATMTGPIATVGEQGFQAEMFVVGFDDPQENDSTTCDVTLRPCAVYVTAPAFVQIAGGG